jgi:DNA repair protein RadD
MFTTFLNQIGNPKVVGFTATPYRQDQMYIRNEFGGLETHTTTKLINRIKQRFWHRIVYNINSEDLVRQGFLVPLKYLDKSVIQHKDIPTNISKSDFNLQAYEEKIEDKWDEILEAIFFGQELGKSVLVFCSSVDQAQRLQQIVPDSEVVTAKTPKKERADIIERFRRQRTQTVFNVGVLTTGFDHPTLDCIILLRPTRSIGLYYQMLGRGVRPAEGKKFCWVLDMTGTVKALGRIETIKMVKREKWELESEKGSWHNKPLYSYILPQ